MKPASSRSWREQISELGQRVLKERRTANCKVVWFRTNFAHRRYSRFPIRSEGRLNRKLAMVGGATVRPAHKDQPLVSVGAVLGATAVKNPNVTKKGGAGGGSRTHTGRKTLRIFTPSAAFAART